MLSFIKMQAAGNDYVFFDCRNQTIADPAGLARRVNDRHFGIGGDGAVFLLPDRDASLRMRIFNADGSEGLMCGNAARAAALYAWRSGWVREPELRLSTASGTVALRLLPDGSISAVLGKAALLPLPAATLAGHPLTGVAVGNPHAVLRVGSVRDFDLRGAAEELALCTDVNLEIYEVLSPRLLRARVYERGSGETLACGTGAAAVVFAAASENIAASGSPVSVEMPGGVLAVTVSAGGTVMLSGPAEEVFRGTWEEDRASSSHPY